MRSRCPTTCPAATTACITVHLTAAIVAVRILSPGFHLNADISVIVTALDRIIDDIVAVAAAAIIAASRQ